MSIDFDSEDEEAVADLIAKLRGKHDTQDLGEDIDVYAFILVEIISSLTDRVGKESEAEQRGEVTWLERGQGRYEHLLASGQYLHGAVAAMSEAMSVKEEE